MSVASLSGRCRCGAVRYSCGTPATTATLCHCESCRRTAGAHVVAWLTTAARDFTLTAGSPVEYRSSPSARRSFCGRCGTPLSYRHDSRPDEVDVQLATLDEAAVFAPVDHVWMVDALPWDRPADGLPQYPQSRPMS